MLAGLPAYVGLYASMAPILAYALFGSSRVLAVGPVAVVSLMTAAAVGQVASPGTPEYWAAALLLAALSGAILIAMGVLRLGFLANLLSHPVISGFITASGILIAASQLKHVLGVSTGGDTLLEILARLAGSLGSVNPVTMAIGVAAMAFLLWVRSRLKPLLARRGVPPRLADIGAKAGRRGRGHDRRRGAAGPGREGGGRHPQGLPPLTMPHLDPALIREPLPAAVLISLIGFVESVSVAQTLAARRRQRIDADNELVGLGAANLAAAFTGGYPTSPAASPARW